MTLDALLNILLAVVVPGLMALIGGVLAARALPREIGKKNPEMWYWISGFVFLFLVSIVLAFVREVRSTAQQRAADQKAAQAELRSTGDIKYMQGQLDSINKVLSTLSSNSNPQQAIGILKSLIPHSGELARPAIERMSNKDLRGRISAFASQMRNWNAKWEQADEAFEQNQQAENMKIPLSDKAAMQQHFLKESQQSAQRSIQFRNEYNNQFAATAITYRDELIRRLGPQPIETGMNRPLALDEGWIERQSVIATANYLEKLANKLPDK